MRSWTPAEDRILLEYADSAKVFKQLPHRSEEAIKKRCYRLGFALFQGSWTLQRVCRETGYNWKQILRAKKALKQVWPRKRHKYLIGGDKVDALVEYLSDEPAPYRGRDRHGRATFRRTWARNHDKCRRCGTDGIKTTQRHAGWGLCLLCYRTARLANALGPWKLTPFGPAGCVVKTPAQC
jgi:hypothetical protein